MIAEKQRLAELEKLRDSEKRAKYLAMQATKGGDSGIGTGVSGRGAGISPGLTGAEAVGYGLSLGLSGLGIPGGTAIGDAVAAALANGTIGIPGDSPADGGGGSLGGGNAGGTGSSGEGGPGAGGSIR